MREDMAQLLVERPRRGGGSQYPRNARSSEGHLPLEDRPRHESMRRPWSNCRKNLNENLAPLRRFLGRRVGCLWDDVYSEICEQLQRDSAVQLHVWQHLMWEVARDPLTIAKLRNLCHRRRRHFYVDPRTKRLRILDGVRVVPKSNTFSYTMLDGVRPCRTIDGIWYEVQLRPIPKSAERFRDAVLRRDCSIHDITALRETHGQDVYAASKRQLGSREIRQLPIERGRAAH